MRQQAASGVPEKATQGAEARRRSQWWWTEASIWTERMVSALGNGVKGGKWYGLMDKVVRPTTLAVAWRKVARNQGAAGVDGQSIERFTAQAEQYLQELQHSLGTGSYRPHPVKRVEIPKADGRTRPLGIPTVKSLPSRKRGTGSCRRLSKWSSSRSLKRSSGRAATASGRGAVARTRCGKSIGC